MQQVDLRMIDLGDNFVCKSCETKHVKITVVTKRTVATHGFLHVVVTTLLIPLVLFIQLTEQELHQPEKRKVIVVKEDDLHNKPITQKKGGKKKRSEA